MDQVTLTTDLQAFPPGTDYFTALGLPRRLVIDTKHLESTFHDLSRRFHPDRHATAGARTRVISLENTALVNKAYRTLRDPWERARYLVELESGANADIGAQPPTNLFEQILELQELTGDLRAAIASGESPDGLVAEVQRAGQPFREAAASLDARLEGLFARWDAAQDGAEPRAAIVADLRSLLGERRYLLRVTADIESALQGRPAPRDI